MTDITWPRHSDGTSDYDDEIKPPLVQLSDDSSFVADIDDEIFEYEEEYDWDDDRLFENNEEITEAIQSNQKPGLVVKQSSNLMLIAILVSVGILLILVIILIIIKKRNKYGGFYAY